MATTAARSLSAAIPVPAPAAPAVSHHSSSQLLEQQQQQQQQLNSGSAGSSFSESHQQRDSASLSSSPPQFPTELSPSIPEEEDEDSESVSNNEPVTPVSGRQSGEFPAVRSNHDSAVASLTQFPSLQPESNKASIDLPKGPFANSNFKFGADTAAEEPNQNLRPVPASTNNTSAAPASRPTTARTSAEDPQPPPTQDRRRSTRGSTSSGFKRTMSNLMSSRKPQQPDSQQSPFMVVAHQNQTEAPRRWSMARSSGVTTQSASPTSPTSPIESKHLAVPEPQPLSKKNRSATGFSLRDRAVNFALGNGKNQTKRDRRRASSFDGQRPNLDHKVMDHITLPRQDLYITADVGAGAKTRRLSLSLPNDIVIDVANLTDEFEYQHKLFGRHREILGKGATARVRVMARKGFPNELYAVKEFRGKTATESQAEYDKKVKSEFSISKSLHHPNIIETVRLCIDHGRWNHVMEYCTEGDLHSLVKHKKGYLRKEERQPDRLCLFKQLIQGLNYLHSNGIAHRDIKLENLLMTKDSKLKITDFGVSEVFSGIHPGARESGGECGRAMGEVRLCNPGICGSEPYIAPEVLAKDRKYDPRALDVWSAGVCMITLYGGNILWEKAAIGAPNSGNYESLVKAFDKWNAKFPDGNGVISESSYPSFAPFDWFFNPPALRRVLLMMLNPNPDKRASISQILNHRWVKNIECCQPESYDDPQVVIDATKSASVKGTRKIFCHNHLPPQVHNTHSLGKMPGQAGY